MPPVPIITPKLLAAIRAHPFLPRNSWHFVSAAALNALNRPDEMANVFKYAIGKGPGDRSEHELDVPAQLVIIRQMREALVKSAAICGLPRSINSLLELRKVTPPEFLDEPLAYSPTGRSNELYNLSSSPVLARGKRFFDLVYGKISARVMGQMDSSGTEDLGLTARLMYSFLLSNERILDASQTSYVLLAGLIPQDVLLSSPRGRQRS
ncbi:MAG: hypothetical protein OHK93_007709 [Ramalina farinacea]|uniref:Uncharacterized protein n=1 Tax=Ramalina farinacea TaxID=258253 RepID=A0AA43QN61_9LECA|nr:hypothetical protein [Ramalina farinacea]